MKFARAVIVFAYIGVSIASGAEVEVDANANVEYRSMPAPDVKQHSVEGDEGRLHDGVVPDVIDALPAEFGELTVTWRNTKAEMGNRLRPSQIRTKPVVNWDANPEKFYTLVMVDPDAPNRKNPMFKDCESAPSSLAQTVYYVPRRSRLMFADTTRPISIHRGPLVGGQHPGR